MLPGNVDPRRPEKVQRYKPPTANGQGEDLTPDYMNILGQRATSANAAPETTVDKHVVDGVAVVTKPPETTKLQQPPLSQVLADPAEETSTVTNKTSPPTNANVIPTSPQYGVAIIPGAVQCPTTDIATETVTIVTDTVTDSTAKQPPDDVAKDLHSTPSRNDRFKVVKIASLEPFKRGRWKCMDYVDEAPPPATQSSKAAQSASSIPIGAAGGVYLQTQSLPQQQIQQMLLQSGYSNGTQFFQTVPAQMMPPTQYFYPAAANVQGTQNVPQQLVNVVPGSIPTQFINASQPYFATAGVVPNSAGFAIPPNYQNIQYPTNILSNQNQSAFAPPTSQPGVQLPVNFQQSQSYSGQPSASQINGHAFPSQSEQQQQQQQQQQLQLASTSISTQATTSKSSMNANVQPPASSQSQAAQPTVQSQIPLVQTGTQSRSVPIIQAQQYPNYQIPPGSQQLLPQQQNPQTIPPVQAFDQNQANNVYTNPQFDMNVNSLTVLENPEGLTETVNETSSGTEVAASENANDDPSKTNPVVNAIDNKIEQAMDLVKSHLMYTVREEVEVLKEKIAELMEKIQQLETENNFLRSQIPKGAATAPPGGGPPAASTTAPPLTTTTSTTTEAAVPSQPQQQ